GLDNSLGELGARILERTGGNPFFTEEVVQALAASGSLVGEHGAYRLTAPIEALALPVTVQALLASRIDRLGERAKHLLEAAAVIGKQFDEPLLREVSGVVDDRDLDAALSMLQEQDFLRLVTLAPHPEYAFKHPLMGDVAYHSQLGDRAVLNRSQGPHGYALPGHQNRRRRAGALQEGVRCDRDLQAGATAASRLHRDSSAAEVMGFESAQVCVGVGPARMRAER